MKCLVYAVNRVRVRGGTVTVCNASRNTAKIVKIVKIVGLDSQLTLVEVEPDIAADRQQA